jgi:midasin
VLSDVIKLQLGDQTDSKTLLGTYVCSEIPGEFVWKAGALTKVCASAPHLGRRCGSDLSEQAALEGRWILIEDLDMAPADVLHVLVPLLESQRIFIPGRAEVCQIRCDVLWVSV